MKHRRQIKDSHVGNMEEIKRHSYGENIGVSYKQYCMYVEETVSVTVTVMMSKFGEQNGPAGPRGMKVPVTVTVGRFEELPHPCQGRHRVGTLAVCTVCDFRVIRNRIHSVWFIRNTVKFDLVLFLNFSEKGPRPVAYLFLIFSKISSSLFLKNWKMKMPHLAQG